MKHLKTLAAAAFLSLVLSAGQAMAHTALCNCFDNGDGTVTCEEVFPTARPRPACP
jgi:hypothetical protein